MGTVSKKGTRDPARGSPSNPVPTPPRSALPSPRRSPAPSPPPLHNSKACQAGSRLLAPGSAPGKKKRKKKKGKSRREGARGLEKGPRSETAPLAHTAQRSPSPTPAPPNPNWELPHPGGQRARAQHRSIIYGRINYSAAQEESGAVKAGRGSGCGDHPARGRGSPAGPRALGVGRRRHSRGPVVRKLPRGGLREEREGTCGSGEKWLRNLSIR